MLEVIKNKALIWFEGHLGAGDAKLSFNLAEGLARNGYEVHLLSSSIERWRFMLKTSPNIHLHHLPSLERRQDQHYYTPAGTRFPDDHGYVQQRRNAIVRAFEDILPDLVITQGWPIGRNPFDTEMLDFISAIREQPAKAVLAGYFFDVNFVTTDENGKQKRKAQFIDQLPLFDTILIPGNSALDYTAAMPQLKPLKDKLFYAGYMVEPFDTRPTKPQEEVLVCSGGGWHDSDLPFYLGAIRSRKFSEMKDDVWRVKVSIKLCSDEMYQAIIDAAREEDPSGSGIIVEPADGKFQQQMVNAKMVVIRSGYNTLVEAVYAGKHVVTFPRPYKGFDREQQARAEALENLGYVRMVTHIDLETIVLGAKFNDLASILDAEVHREISALPALDTNAADNAAAHFNQIIAGRKIAVTKAHGEDTIERGANEVQ